MDPKYLNWSTSSSKCQFTDSSHMGIKLHLRLPGSESNFLTVIFGTKHTRVLFWLSEICLELFWSYHHSQYVVGKKNLKSAVAPMTMLTFLLISRVTDTMEAIFQRPSQSCRSEAFHRNKCRHWQVRLEASNPRWLLQILNCLYPCILTCYKRSSNFPGLTIHCKNVLEFIQFANGNYQCKFTSYNVDI